VEGLPAKPQAGALAALSAALQSLHDVDADDVQPNSNEKAQALRARQQKPARAHPRWGAVGDGNVTVDRDGSGGLSSELAAMRDAGLAMDTSTPLPVPTAQPGHAAPCGTAPIDPADG